MLISTFLYAHLIVSFPYKLHFFHQLQINIQYIILEKNRQQHYPLDYNPVTWSSAEMPILL